jgi:hypothetical protein
MYIRLATKDDLDEIYQLFDNYTKETLRDYSTIFDKDKAQQAISRLVRINCAFIGIESEKIIGGMAGVITPCLFSSDIIFNSLFFFIHEDYRRFTKEFLRQVEEAFKKTKITRLIIGHPAMNNGKVVDRFYRMLGFQKLEIQYFKAV